MEKAFTFNLLIHPKLNGQAYAGAHVIVFQPSVLDLFSSTPHISTDIFTAEISDETAVDILRGAQGAAEETVLRLHDLAAGIHRMQPAERQQVASALVKRLKAAVELYHGAVPGYPF